MTYGVKISKEGHDAKTASGDELIFSDEYALMKIHGIYDSTVTVDIGNAYGDTTLENPLSYFPVAWHFVNLGKNSGTVNWRPIVMSGTPSASVNADFSACSAQFNEDINSFYFRLYDQDDADTRIYQIKSVIFVNKLK